MQKGHNLENKSTPNVDLGEKTIQDEKLALEVIDHSKWKQLNENPFDRLFGYERGLEKNREIHQKPEYGMLEEKLPKKEEVKLNKLRNRLH